MDDLRLHAVVARVVAWHNSHPLARRITAAQVNSVGYVALPCMAPGLLSPAPSPPVVPLPAPPPAEPVDIEPVIETDEPGAIVIDVGPGLQASAVMVVDSGAGPRGDRGPSAPDFAAPVATTPAAACVSSLRARAAAAEGDPVAEAAPAPLSVLPAPNSSRTLVCSGDFIAPLPIGQLLDWVRTHGLALQRAPVDGPVHEVPVDPALLPPGAGVALLWVATAAIEVGGQRHRVLLGGGEVPAVLGRRTWSRPRLLGVLSMLAALGVLAVAAVWWLWPAASAASAAALPTVTEAAPPAASAASAPEAPASAAAVDGERHDEGTRPLRLPALLDDAAKARARADVAALRAERQASAPVLPAAAAVAVAMAPPPKAAPVAPAAQAAAPTTVLYGLSTRLLRTRAEAEQLQSAFQALLGGTPGSPLRVELLPAGDDWRVVCWPYAQRADAERARALLQARGLRVELVDF